MNKHFDIDRAAVEIHRDKSTGTGVKSSGYQQLVEYADAVTVNIITVYEVSRLACSIRDVLRTADRVRDADVELHVVSEGLTLRPSDDDPYQDVLFQLFGVFAEHEAKIRRKNVWEGITARRKNVDYHHGPAPLGFEKNDGQLRGRYASHFNPYLNAVPASATSRCRHD